MGALLWDLDHQNTRSEILFTANHTFSYLILMTVITGV